MRATRFLCQDRSGHHGIADKFAAGAVSGSHLLVSDSWQKLSNRIGALSCRSMTLSGDVVAPEDSYLLCLGKSLRELTAVSTYLNVGRPNSENISSS